MESTDIQQHEIAEIEEFADKRDTMLGEIRKVIVGQDEVIEEVLIALFAKGHCLLVGVPGLAKTLLISTLAEILDLPFFVLATQNPIEQEGTYPLPEAQLDRFMLNIEIRYPSFDDEVQIVMQTTSTEKPSPRKVMEGGAILRYQDLVRKVPVSPFVVSYAVALAQRSRPKNLDALQFVKDYVEWGAGPRASQYLILGAKARTILQGRYAVSTEDIQALAPSVLRHRIVPNFKAQGEGLSSADIINRLLTDVKPSADGKAIR